MLERARRSTKAMVSGEPVAAEQPPLVLSGCYDGAARAWGLNGESRAATSRDNIWTPCIVGMMKERTSVNLTGTTTPLRC